MHFATRRRKVAAAERCLSGAALYRRLAEIERESVKGWHPDGRPRDSALLYLSRQKLRPNATEELAIVEAFRPACSAPSPRLSDRGKM